MNSATRLSALIALLLIGLGCKAEPAKPAAPPAAKIIDKDSLQFDSPEVQQRFQSFDGIARKFGERGYDHRPYQLGGNFVQAVWAKGIGFTERPMLRGPRESLKPIHRITVDTIVVPPPQATATGLSVEAIAPDPKSWCVLFHYREGNGHRVTGSGWGITFFRWDPDHFGKVVPFQPYDQSKERIMLPITGYAVGDSAVGLFNEQALPQNFGRQVRSAEAMRDAYIADLAELEKRTVALIQSHKAQKKVYGKYQGGGIPPDHTLQPLTPEEEKEELAKAKRYFADQAMLMRDNHQAMYAAWRKSFPIEDCWPELKGK